MAEIKRLDEHVVNRIAAGEIIQRPANAVKELLENALDAGATSIRITVKDGGLKQLQIQDNGKGIRKEDLPILCERFTTSKLRSFEDLHSLNTYGFRGEALASISHISHLTVTTKTHDADCAWKASYVDGKLTGTPTPSAGNDGTLFNIQDLFYNTPARLKALRSPGDEYARLLATVVAYAVHNTGVSIMCKKQTSTPDVNTLHSSSITDNIVLYYGEGLRGNLVQVSVPPNGAFGVEGWCSGLNYSGKKGVFLFFVNNRLVECPPIKKALEAYYATVLPKGSSPFVYLSISVPPEDLDVNVHPTKQAVGFEAQDDAIDAISAALAANMEPNAKERVFQVQTLLPSAFRKPLPPSSQDADTPTDPSSPVATQKKKAMVYPHKMVRTDALSQTIDSMFPRVPAASSKDKRREGGDSSCEEDTSDTEAPIVIQQTVPRLAPSECLLTSVQTLRDRLEKGASADLTRAIKNHSFVGVVSLSAARSAIQHETRLYLVDHDAVLEGLIYQLALRQFGCMARIHLTPPPSLKDLIQLGIESSATASHPASEEAAEQAYHLLFEKREMLSEYFSFDIDDTGHITAIPRVLPGYVPSMNGLPLLALRIAVQVNWTAERECFDTFCKEIAFFHRTQYCPSDNADTDELREIIKTIVFPAARMYYIPPKTAQKDFVLMTSIERLYRVFERC